MQKKLNIEPACPGKDEGNIAISIGLSDTFNKYFDLIGMNDLLDSFKSRGEALSPLIRCMCVHSLEGENSMQSCSKWASNPEIRDLLGIEGTASQRTMNRALEIIGNKRVEIIERLFNGITGNFDIKDNAVAADGSSVIRESDHGDLAATGHPRDKNPDGMQTEFMMAVFQSSKIPFYIGAFSGEVSDEEQYARSLPEILSLLDYGRMDAYSQYLEEWKSPDQRERNEQIRPFKEGVDLSELRRHMGPAQWIVIDNGGASKYNTDLICGLGHEYITRKKLNESDKNRSKDETWEYVEPGVWCHKNTFDSSKRTTYLYFNEALYALKRRNAVKRFERRMEVTRKVMEGKIPKSEMVQTKDLPFVDFDVTVTVQNVLSDFTEEDREREIKRMMGRSPGIFKLESSSELTPKQALDLYRERVVIEHTISSIKQVSGIKPLRVWRKASVIGSMVLALLVEAVLSMARFDLRPVKAKKRKHGVERIVDTKPSTNTIKESLRHLTVTRIKEKDGSIKLVYSNWEPISVEIFEALEHHLAFGKHWKSRIPA